MSPNWLSFTKNQVWYAQASTFNDPFDCDHFIDIDRSTDEWREIMEHFEERFGVYSLGARVGEAPPPQSHHIPRSKETGCIRLEY